MKKSDIKDNPYTTAIRDDDSTVIEAFRYNPDELTLDVKFLTGKTYRYQRVGTDTAARLAFSTSSGRFFNAHIKGKYDSKRFRTYF
jgi:hypothetical protein